MESKSKQAESRRAELGKAEGAATEAAFRGRLTGKVQSAPSHDPYNGAIAEPKKQAKRTDLRQLSRQIQLSRQKGKQKG